MERIPATDIIANVCCRYTHLKTKMSKVIRKLEKLFKERKL